MTRGLARPLKRSTRLLSVMAAGRSWAFRGGNKRPASQAWADQRRRMVANQLVARGIRDQRVLEAMTDVPRHLFVPRSEQWLAYDDRPLPIGEGQTISQPYIVALMLEALRLKGDECVLEIGTGSGYQTALLDRLAGEVVSIERVPELAEAARKRLERLGINRPRIVVGDGTEGFPEAAPYDRIVITAAAPDVPQPLLDQLATPGILVVPLGQRDEQLLVAIHRSEQGDRRETLCACRFVPLLGRYGFAT